jgi:hypothetical protein
MFNMLNRKDLIYFGFLNIVFLLVYIYVWVTLGYPDENFVFNTFDSQSYRSSGAWLFGSGAGEYINIRPFLFPLIVYIFNFLFSFHGIFWVNTLLWFVTGNIVLLSVWQLTKSRYWVFVSCMFYVSELSLIALCGHGLTEIYVAFFTSLIVFLYIKSNQSKKYYIHICWILSILSCVKPVFLSFYLLIFIIYLFNISKEKKLNTYIFLTLLPILLQITIYTSKYHKVGFSEIGKIALNRYYFAQGTSNLHHISFDSARVVVKDYNTIQTFSTILSNPGVYFNTYLDLLNENFDGDPIYFTFPDRHEKLYIYTKQLNHMKFYLHLILIIPLLFVFVKKKEFRFLIILFSYMVLTTGLSFKQGDRYATPIVAIWAVLYCAVFTLKSSQEQKLTV